MNSSTPSTLFSRGSHLGIEVAQVLKLAAGLLWQVLQEKPVGPRFFHKASAFSMTHMAGLFMGSRLSSFPSAFGRLLGSSEDVLNTAGDFNVLRKATMS